MTLRDPRSIIIIFFYLTLNAGILWISFTLAPSEESTTNTAKSLAPEYTIIEHLDYFNTREGVPQLSLSALKMSSQGEDVADFVTPKGVYNYQAKNRTIRYQGESGSYRKKEGIMGLKGEVELRSDDGEYYADEATYYFTKDTIIGNGRVKFIGDDLKSKDHVVVHSDHLTAHPDRKLGFFKDNVNGSMMRKKKYEGKIDFRSRTMDLDGFQSFAHLEGDVWMKRGDRQVTSGKADIYLENYNKSLKYFVLNDDVKVTEKLSTPSGITERRSFSERLEGFGQEQKMVLSGAPRVETGADVIKGYRITIRENTDLIEVDDAMSDMKVKREEKKNN